MTKEEEALYKQWITIFRAGVYKSHGVSYSEKDLDNIITNTENEKVAIVINHPTNNSYSLGKIAGLKRVGADLKARFKDFDLPFIQSIKNGLFPTRSVRIKTEKGKDFLDHLGFLVHKINPAVKNMGTIAFSDETTKDFEFNNEIKIKINETKTKTEGYKMDTKELEVILKKGVEKDNKISALEQENKDFAEKVIDFAGLEDTIKKLEATIKKLEDENKVLKEEAQKVKQNAFSEVIKNAVEKVTTDEKKKEVKEKLEKHSKNFSDVKDFSEIVGMMGLETKVKADTKEEDFSDEKEGEKSNSLVKDFSELIENEDKALKFKAKNPKKYEQMENAFLSK